MKSPLGMLALSRQPWQSCQAELRAEEERVAREEASELCESFGPIHHGKKEDLSLTNRRINITSSQKSPPVDIYVKLLLRERKPWLENCIRTDAVKLASAD